MTATTTAPTPADLTVGTLVRFRPDFGAVGASGLVFTIDGEVFADNVNGGRPCVGIKIRRSGRMCYRLAYVTDLRIV